MWWNVYLYLMCFPRMSDGKIPDSSWLVLVFCVFFFQHLRVELAQILGKNPCSQTKPWECFKYLSTTTVLYGGRSEDVNRDGCLDIQSSSTSWTDVLFSECADSNLWLTLVRISKKYITYRSSSVQIKKHHQFWGFSKHLTLMYCSAYKDSQNLKTLRSGPVLITYQYRVRTPLTGAITPGTHV